MSELTLLPTNRDTKSTPGQGASSTISKNGFEFDYRTDRWQLARAVTVNVAFLSHFENAVAEDMREALVHYAETSSPKYVANICNHLRLYLKESKACSFTELGFVAFKNSLPKSDEYRVAFVRAFIRQMRFLGLAENFDNGVFELTDKWRLKGNDKGVAVMSLDPIDGPFSDMEFEAIGHNAAHCYAEGDISTEEYCVILLFKATGRRPEQLALCKCKDFYYTNKLDGSPTMIGNIPRIKQRQGTVRSTFRPFAFVKSVAQIIEQHLTEVASQAEYLIGRTLSTEERGELPLFLSKSAPSTMAQLPENKLLPYLSSELAHISSPELVTLLKAAVDELYVVSERTGEQLHVNAYRFRYTLGTRAAQQGAGKLTIATLLDHSDIQNVDVYVKNVPEFAVEISKIMNQPLARYASAFAGRLVEDEEEANRGNPGATRIPCHEKDCAVGSCGTSAFCQDYAPIACYLCPKFRPWANAPHHLVLEWLMEERERLKSATKGDMQIVAINDRAIVAVCQVIKLAQEHHQNG